MAKNIIDRVVSLLEIKLKDDLLPDDLRVEDCAKVNVDLKDYLITLAGPNIDAWKQLLIETFHNEDRVNKMSNDVLCKSFGYFITKKDLTSYTDKFIEMNGGVENILKRDLKEEEINEEIVQEPEDLVMSDMEDDNFSFAIKEEDIESGVYEEGDKILGVDEDTTLDEEPVTMAPNFDIQVNEIKEVIRGEISQQTEAIKENSRLMSELINELAKARQRNEDKEVPNKVDEEVEVEEEIIEEEQVEEEPVEERVIEELPTEAEIYNVYSRDSMELAMEVVRMETSKEETLNALDAIIRLYDSGQMMLASKLMDVIISR